MYNASTSPQYENGTCELNHLSPGQEYEVWIQAVTAAGPGARATARFKTKQHENYGTVKFQIGVISGLIVLLMLSHIYHPISFSYSPSVGLKRTMLALLFLGICIPALLW